MNLSEHFTLEEFLRSETAVVNAIKLEPTESEIEAMRQLCVSVLEPMRLTIGSRIIITSGFRNAELNKAVGGAAGSQHMRGEAADIKVDTADLNRSVSNYLYETRNYDQAIVYGRSYGNMFFHLSFTNRYEPRRELLYKLNRN